VGSHRPAPFGYYTGKQKNDAIDKTHLLTPVYHFPCEAKTNVCKLILRETPFRGFIELIYCIDEGTGFYILSDSLFPLEPMCSEAMKAILENLLIKRAETPEDLTRTSGFPASDGSDFITGQTIIGDGGRCSVRGMS
jgi:hypothetical protein